MKKMANIVIWIKCECHVHLGNDSCYNWRWRI